ncbi:transcriptional corepressor LEUNIG_HOMOLOG-like [Diospyros lotus]|uniref:transcriptional corepressor LEUNIG_HOMOLOG-like n=1 Tax=Diospyros lotus TaxID=55363 RepID=UPI00225577F8|nr:transcriptional corepressor LEUNIG_HOMOLOG-like [Diospyros lotus]
MYSSLFGGNPRPVGGSSDQAGRMSGNEQQQSDALAVPNPGTNQTRTGHLHADRMAAQCSATASRMLTGDSSRLHHGGFNSNQIPPPDDKATLAMLPPSHSHSLGMQFSSQASAVGLTSSTGAHTGSSQQQIPDNAPRWTARDTHCGVSLGETGFWGSTLYGSQSMFPGARLIGAGTGNGANSMLLEGWPLTGVSQIPPSVMLPALNSILPMPNQQQPVQTSMAHHEQVLLAEEMAKTPGNQISYFERSTDTFGNVMLPMGDLRKTDAQTLIPATQTSAQQGMTIQQQISIPLTQTEVQMIMIPVGQSAGQQQNNQLTQQHSPEDARNAKDDSDDSYLQYLSIDEDIAIAMNTPFSTLPGSSTAGNMNEQDGFSLQEIGRLLSKKGAIVCCDFSSDGELLATVGHGEKVYIWSVKEFDCIKHGEGHFGLITDIRFRPSSSFFATSSFDRTVQIWDADRPRRPVFPLVGHTGKVTSIDFHPVNSDILCSCDNTDQIRIWHVNSTSCAHVFKGGSRQVRFQPQSGDLLAAASENAIKLFDVQTNTLLCCLEGHLNEVNSICWDTSGKYMASVSEDSARIWSVASYGKPIHVLDCRGNRFGAGIFHPGYSQLLVVGSYQALQLWNPTLSNQTLAIPAHEDVISTLADCPLAGVFASAGKDEFVRIWR